MKKKNIQIPEELFINLVKYFLLEAHNTDTYNVIKSGIEEKYNAIEKHNLYTEYKTAATKQEKENARLNYLDKTNIPDNFRY